MFGGGSDSDGGGDDDKVEEDELHDGDDDGDDDEPWEETWILEPLRRCQPVALYQLALTHSQLGQHELAAAALRRFDGVKYRIAPEVWDCARRPPAPPPAATAGRPKKTGGADGRSPVRLYGPAVPAVLGRRLREAFKPGAAYWTENDYGQRGYFSWYHPLRPAAAVSVDGPANAVEQLIELIRVRGPTT